MPSTHHDELLRELLGQIYDELKEGSPEVALFKLDGLLDLLDRRIMRVYGPRSKRTGLDINTRN